MGANFYCAEVLNCDELASSFINQLRSGQHLTSNEAKLTEYDEKTELDTMFR